MVPERFCVEKRKMQVLQNNYNELLGHLLWRLEVTIITVCVVGLCGTVWTEGFQALRRFVVSAFCITFLATIWTGLGAVYETSAEILFTWRHPDGVALHARKFIVSMRPIRFQIGDYFYVDGTMTLTLLGIIAEYTFSVLLAF